MRWSVPNESHFYFNKHGYVRFEGLIKEEASQPLIHDQAFWKKTPEKVFLEGRDLWRTHAEWAKIARDRHILTISNELLNVKPIRLAYTQAIRLTKSPHPDHFQNSTIESLIKTPIPLLESSCFQGLCIAALICLECEENTDLPDFFPRTPGEVTFFQPTMPFPLDALYGHADAKMMLVVYSLRTVLYVLRPKDPHTHQLKKLGYGFGDHLKDKTHPTVFN
ncbi:MAG: hypothetical protein JHC93_03335 [Parachlamydiales bacterium]|nr:hypothetical protein [Parachlamydiales bacterium]